MSGRIQAAVQAYIQARDWPHTVEGSITSFPGFGSNGAWTVHVVVREDDQQVLVHSVLREDVPAERREALALFLTRANFGLVLGNFELDLDDGELRYKTSIDVEGAELVDKLIDNLVLANVSVTDRYLPGIRAVAAGSDPVAAVTEVEAPAPG